MNEINMGECEWPEPHPPHLWGESPYYPGGSSATTLWACSGKADDE